MRGFIHLTKVLAIKVRDVVVETYQAADKAAEEKATKMETKEEKSS